MIFLTFVENAFKYGASTSMDCKILIRIHINKGILLFETENKIVRHADDFRKDMPVGINNCKSRLSGLFPGRHSFNIKEENGLFKVHLKINLNSHE
ncbi:MAG: histidine kinase, partial [Prevotellaceae bacterium]|nr:histidine kinase [Prevotellaceae bacterium]